MKLNLSDKAMEHIQKKGGRAALDLICVSNWSAKFTEVSVDTYIGNRNTRNYRTFQQDGIEVMVSNALAPYIRQIELDCKKFLFMHKLKAEMELSNGRWISV